MKFNFFKFFLPKKFVGIDVGTSSIKIVEISRWGGGKTLENYGEIEAKSLFKESFQVFDKNTNMLSEQFTARAIKAVLEEAKIKTKSAIFSLPDFSTFFTSFDLPPMKEKEISEAIKFTAPKHIPLPMQETTLDWRIISGVPGNKKSHLKILVAAIPNKVVENYSNTAKMTGLDLYALEAEVFGIIRSSVGENKKTICLLDIGAQSSTISIVENGVLKKSNSSDFSNNQLTHSVAASLNIKDEEAEEKKKKHGLEFGEEKEIKSNLTTLIDPFLVEIKRVMSENSQEIEEVFLTGGAANLPGLKKYMSESLKKKVIIPNSFSNLLSTPVLSETLQEMSPRFSVAVGMAMQGLEEKNHL